MDTNQIQCTVNSLNNYTCSTPVVPYTIPDLDSLHTVSFMITVIHWVVSGRYSKTSSEYSRHTGVTRPGQTRKKLVV